MAWPHDLKTHIIENGTIQKLGYSFLLYSIVTIDISAAILYMNMMDTGQTPHDSIGCTYTCIVLQKCNIYDIHVRQDDFTLQ